MKIAAISDLHGNLSFDVKKSDILCICGDIIPLDVQRNYQGSKDWLKNRFIPWCERKEVTSVYLIGGNHDFFICKHQDELNDMLSSTKIQYLQDTSAVYIDEDGNEYNIYGSPWCHKFGHWAFMDYSDEELEAIFKTMPNGIDIMLTHDAPYGCSDVCLQQIWPNHKRDEHIGSKGLASAIIDKKPKLLLHGHLHSANHDVEKLGDTKVYNVSMLDETYSLKYQPLYMDYIK